MALAEDDGIHAGQYHLLHPDLSGAQHGGQPAGVCAALTTPPNTHLLLPLSQSGDKNWVTEALIYVVALIKGLNYDFTLQIYSILHWRFPDAV